MFDEVRCAVATLKAIATRRVDETHAYREGGHRSAAHWLATTTGAKDVRFSPEAGAFVFAALDAETDRVFREARANGTGSPAPTFTTPSATSSSAGP